ncbi:LOW QUALITY PROTEIN: hypothetical protein NC651_037766 [Populus alba x Populus x berolinensis]|nr:LOW QUALITY PROTEIN: hypothetical protein NC651_037766 [Populus alba x Populus x berolinensis]
MDWWVFFVLKHEGLKMVKSLTSIAGLPCVVVVVSHGVLAVVVNVKRYGHETEKEIEPQILAVLHHLVTSYYMDIHGPSYCNHFVKQLSALNMELFAWFVEQRNDTGPADKWCQLPFHQGGYRVDMSQFWPFCCLDFELDFLDMYYLNNTYARIG